MSDIWLAHHGIAGQKWGIRRFQNKDGSLTSAGRRRYKVGEAMDDNDSNDSSVTRRVKKDYNELSDKDFKRKYQASKNTYRKRVNKYGDPYMNSPLAKYGKKLSKKQGKDPDKVAEDETNGSVATPRMSDKTKKALKTAAIVGAAAVATGLVAYGAYKGSNLIKTEAGRRILENGEKEMNRLMSGAENAVKISAASVRQSRVYEPGSEAEKVAMNTAMSWQRIAAERRVQAIEVGRQTDKEYKDTSSSVVKSAKYLIDQRRKKKRS